MKKIFEDILDNLEDIGVSTGNDEREISNGYEDNISVYKHRIAMHTCAYSFLTMNPKPLHRLIYLLNNSFMFSEYSIHVNFANNTPKAVDGDYFEEEYVYSPIIDESINEWCENLANVINATKNQNRAISFNIYFNMRTPSFSRFVCTLIDICTIISAAQAGKSINEPSYRFIWTQTGLTVDSVNHIIDRQRGGHTSWKLTDPGDICEYCDIYYNMYKVLTGSDTVTEKDIDTIVDKYKTIYSFDRILLKQHFHFIPLYNNAWIKNFSHSANSHFITLDNWQQINDSEWTDVYRNATVLWSEMYKFLAQNPHEKTSYHWTIKASNRALLNVIYDEIVNDSHCELNFDYIDNILISGVDEATFKHIMESEVKSGMTTVYIDDIAGINDGKEHKYEIENWKADTYYAYTRENSVPNYEVKAKKSRKQNVKYKSLTLKRINNIQNSPKVNESYNKYYDDNDYEDYDTITEDIRKKTRDYIKTLKVKRPEGWWTTPRKYMNGDTVIPYEFIENDLYHFYFASTSFYTNEFELGIARIAIGELEFDLSKEYSKEFMKLKKILEIIMTAEGEAENYDENLNGMTFSELDERFSNSIEMDRQRMEDRINSREYEQNPEYDIIELHDYDEAREYRDLTNPDSPMSITYDEDRFNAYADNGNNKMFMILYKHYRDIKKPNEPYDEHSKPAHWVDYLDINPDGIPYLPYDEYGLSMIFLSITPDCEINCCTGRWNHEMGDFSRDFLNEEQLSNLLGVNYYQYFCNDVPLDEAYIVKQ